MSENRWRGRWFFSPFLSLSAPTRRLKLLHDAGFERFTLHGFTTPWGWFVGVVRFHKAPVGDRA